MEMTVYCAAIVIAAAVTGVLGKFMIPFLHKLKFGQTIREEGPTWHAAKQGTPTMGGLMFITGGYAAAVICIAFLWMHGGAENQLMIVKTVGGALMAAGFGLVGFMDDYISIRKKRRRSAGRARRAICGRLPRAARLAATGSAIMKGFCRTRRDANGRSATSTLTAATAAASVLCFRTTA